MNTENVNPGSVLIQTEREYQKERQDAIFKNNARDKALDAAKEKTVGSSLIEFAEEIYQWLIKDL